MTEFDKNELRSEASKYLKSYMMTESKQLS